jgi:hypothetical protein
MALMAFSSLVDFIAFTQDNQTIVDFENATRDQMAGLTEIVSEDLRVRDGSTVGVRTKIKLADGMLGPMACWERKVLDQICDITPPNVSALTQQSLSAWHI